MFDIKKLLLIDALKFIPGEAMDLLRIAPRLRLICSKGGYGYFLESHISKPAALDIIMRGSNGLIVLHYRPKQQAILEACIVDMFCMP